MSANNDNSAHYNIPAAILFIVLYSPLLSMFIWRRLHYALWTYTISAIYCVARVASFSIRAVLARLPSTADHSGLKIALAVLSSIGFVGLIWASYEMILDRERITGIPLNGFPAIILTKRHFVYFVMTVASIIDIAGSIQWLSAKDSDGRKTARDLRNASVYIFFGISVLLALQMLLVAYRELITPSPTGLRYIAPLLAAHMMCLMTRECFQTATSNYSSDQIKEALWYPLVAVPELLAVSILAIPGIVPEDTLRSTEEVPVSDTQDSPQKNKSSRTEDAPGLMAHSESV